MRATIAFFHLLQPLARLCGRMQHGLTLWRQRTTHPLSMPVPRTFPVIVTRYREPEQWLRDVVAKLTDLGAVVLNGGDYDQWDLEVRGGFFGSSRLLMAFEDSGSGTQLVRARVWPSCLWGISAALVVCLAVASAAAADRAYVAAAVLGAIATLIGLGIVRDAGGTVRAVHDALAACGLVELHADKRVFQAEQQPM